MKKIKLYAIGNRKNFNYYILDKTNKTARFIAKILRETANLDIKLYTQKENKNNDCVQRKINFEKRKEGHESTESPKGNARADIFYGGKKMFLILHCPQSIRRKFNKALGEISYMPKPKEVKK